jgi:hypothetical protein
MLSCNKIDSVITAYCCARSDFEIAQTKCFNSRQSSYDVIGSDHQCFVFLLIREPLIKLFPFLSTACLLDCPNDYSCFFFAGEIRHSQVRHGLPPAGLSFRIDGNLGNLYCYRGARRSTIVMYRSLALAKMSPPIHMASLCHLAYQFQRSIAVAHHLRAVI